MVTKKAAGWRSTFSSWRTTWCCGGLQATHYMLAKATRYHHNWIALRTSYGMNGIFLHDTTWLTSTSTCSSIRHVGHPTTWLWSGRWRDQGEWRAVTVNVAYRYNIYDHIGLYSTLRSQKQTSFPRCYEMLGEPTLFQVEAFSPKQCPKDDICTCQVQNAEHMYAFQIDLSYSLKNWRTM